MQIAFFQQQKHIAFCFTKRKIARKKRKKKEKKKKKKRIGTKEMNERKLGIKNIIRNRKRESDRDRQNEAACGACESEREMTDNERPLPNKYQRKKENGKKGIFSLNNKEILKEIERERNVLNPFPPHHIKFLGLFLIKSLL